MKQSDDNFTRDELLEMASIDAHGMLDEIETARFERAFVAATPSLQAEIIALQERVALDASLRSGEQPPHSLRLRTLARVAQAVEDEAASAKPIATIGPVGARLAGEPRGSEAIPAESMQTLLREIAERTSAQQPSQLFWRAASFFLVAALAVGFYFYRGVQQNADRLSTFAENQVIDEQIRRDYPGLDGFDFAAAVPMQLRPSGYPAELTAYVDMSQRRVLVVGFRLNEFKQGASILIRSDTGRLHSLDQVRVSSAAWAKVYELPEDFGSVVGFEIEVDGKRFSTMIGEGALTVRDAAMPPAA